MPGGQVDTIPNASRPAENAGLNTSTEGRWRIRCIEVRSPMVVSGAVPGIPRRTWPMRECRQIRRSEPSPVVVPLRDHSLPALYPGLDRRRAPNLGKAARQRDALTRTRRAETGRGSTDHGWQPSRSGGVGNGAAWAPTTCSRPDRLRPMSDSPVKKPPPRSRVRPVGRSTPRRSSWGSTRPAVVCRTCGLRWLRDQPTGGELEVLYGSGFIGRSRPGGSLVGTTAPDEQCHPPARARWAHPADCRRRLRTKSLSCRCASRFRMAWGGR
mgnify:CR=1 FL=1